MRVERAVTIKESEVVLVGAVYFCKLAGNEKLPTQRSFEFEKFYRCLRSSLHNGFETIVNRAVRIQTNQVRVRNLWI